MTDTPESPVGRPQEAYSVTFKAFAETEADIRRVYVLLDELSTRLSLGSWTAYPGLISSTLQIKMEPVPEGGWPE
jgi:hypothetical protein